MTSFLGPKWDVTKELTDIKVASEGRQKYRVTCKDFGDITVLKPFLIALTLMFFFQCTGINIILQFTVDIFQSADSSVQVFQVWIIYTCLFLNFSMVVILSTVCPCNNEVFDKITQFCADFPHEQLCENMLKLFIAKVKSLMHVRFLGCNNIGLS